MSRRSPQTINSMDSIKLPLEPISVRITVAVQLTGIGRSKLYELMADGQLETVKIGASRLILVSSLKKLIRPSTED